MRAVRIGVLLLLVLALSGCAAGTEGETGRGEVKSQESAETGSLPGGPGRYSIEASGAVFLVDVPIQSTDEEASRIEAYRAKVGAPEPGYIRAELDNTEGTDWASLRSVQVVTEEGEQLEVQAAWIVIGDWPQSQDTQVYNEGIELYNSFLNQGEALPGARVRTMLLVEHPLESVASVWVNGERAVKAD